LIVSLKPLHKHSLVGVASSKSRICVVGAGAIGGVLAAMLARAGNLVSVVARGEHLDVIRRDGLKLTSSGGLGAFSVEVRATDSPSELGAQDVILLCVKAHDIPALAARVQSLIADHSVVVPVVNGIPWWYFQGEQGSVANDPVRCLDPDFSIARHIPMGTVIGCVVRITATVERPGVVRHTFGRQFILGEPSNETSTRLEALCEVVRHAGLDATPTRDIRTEIWAKLIGNVATNPLAALTHGSLADLCADECVVAVMRLLMLESRAVGTAYGITFKASIEESLERFRTLGDAKPSMLQDIEKGRPLEIAAILQSVTELARRVDVATPTLDTVLALIAQRARHLGAEHRK
jgi:2-dehydropantoate 2-reductase